MTFFNSGLFKVIKVPLSDWIVLLEGLRGLRLHVKVGSVSLGASHLLSLILWSQSCLSLSSCLDSKWSFQLIYTRSTSALLSASSSKCLLWDILKWLWKGGFWTRSFRFIFLNVFGMAWRTCKRKRMRNNSPKNLNIVILFVVFSSNF